jgi:hypothetical protein
MALYVPASRRRRRIVVAALLALVVGIVIGGLLGRASAPSMGDRIREVQGDARQTAAGLRVVVLHDEAGAAGSGGVDLVLKRTRDELTEEFRRAPWLGGTQRTALTRALDRLAQISDRGSPAFATAAESLAGQIEVTFGIA